MRDCSKNTKQLPYVLAIFYDNRVFNVQIRFCMETNKYTLGTRIKTDDVSNTMVEGFLIMHTTALCVEQVCFLSCILNHHASTRGFYSMIMLNVLIMITLLSLTTCTHLNSI